TVKLVNAAGEPVSDREVTIRLTNHQFLFGCGTFDAIEVANRNVPEDRLAFLEQKLDMFLDVFNYGTLPFYWARFEPERGKPRTAEYVAAAKWLKERNVKVKGHPLCWHTLTAP